MTSSIVSYMWLIAGPPRWMWTIAAAVLAFAVYLAWLGGARQVDQAVAIALFLQLFAASSGFRVRLRAGHFDPVLVLRPSASLLATVHWSVSVGLGLAVWVALGLIGLGSGAVQTPLALTPAGLALILYVSTVSWTIGLAAGRLSGAIAWLALLIALIGTQQFAVLRVGFVAHPENAAEWLSTMRSALIVPAFLIVDPYAISSVVTGSVLAATVIAWLGGVALIRAFDAVLECS